MFYHEVFNDGTVQPAIRRDNRENILAKRSFHRSPLFLLLVDTDFSSATGAPRSGVRPAKSKMLKNCDWVR
jgi:hypothetical protein